MTRTVHIALLTWLALAADGQTAPACHSLSHDQILGRDLAAAIPAMALLPPDLKLGYSPSPGVQRAFRVSQLQQLASQYGISARIPGPVCFAWALHPVSNQEIVNAIRKSLAGQVVDLDITDQSHFAAPEGEVHFPLQGLSGESDKPIVWNGFVEYGGGRKFNIWARVRITVHEKHVIAARSINAGEVIEPSALKTVEYQGPLMRSLVVRDESEAAGQCARWSIPAGSVLANGMLVAPHSVERGQLVTVHVSSGAAHIETQGIADDGGYKGDVIRVHNPKTGVVFRARIDDRGVVTVVPGGKVGLVVEDKKS
jgi:flagella basal body P-ring formation protein FlgA